MEILNWPRQAGGSRTQSKPGPRPGLSLDDLLAAIRILWKHTGRPPTLSELAKAFNGKARATLLPYLARLEQEGKIEREEIGGPGANRAIWPAGLRDKVRALAAES